MRQLILDGYNVIHEIPRLKKALGQSLEGARSDLCGFMQVWKNNHEYSGKIKIIFDGDDAFAGNSKSSGSINCIYTKTGQKADDCIIGMVRESKNRPGITVISNDGYVKGTCSSLGASTRQPAFLLAPAQIKAQKTTGRKNIKNSNNAKIPKKVSASAEKEINDFLKEKWKIE